MSSDVKMNLLYMLSDLGKAFKVILCMLILPITLAVIYYRCFLRDPNASSEDLWGGLFMVILASILYGFIVVGTVGCVG